jgi:hypothetical protein
MCSFRRLRSSSPDQWLRHDHNLLKCPVFNPHGPRLPPCHLSARLSLAAMCHCSHLSHTSRGSPPHLIIHLSLAMYPFPSMSAFHQTCPVHSPAVSAYIPNDSCQSPCHLSHFLSSFFILIRPCCPFHTLITRHHHSCHAPHFPRWPPCLPLKLFGCSRWQREKSSLSQEAVIEAVEGG